jgi:acetyl esterase/lipase
MRPLMTTGRLSLARKRRIVDLIAGASRLPAGVGAAGSVLGGVPIQRITLADSRSGCVMLFLHGGGYASGSARGYRGFAGAIAVAAGMDVVVADYRLAPEHPYPAALEDALAVYRALVEGGAKVVLAGDSAGGGLALALAQRVRDAGMPAPVALGLICPWLDLAMDRSGSRPPAKDPLLVPPLIAEWSEFYSGNSDARDPGISPIYGDLHGLPPIVLHSAGDDPLAIDADALERACLGAVDGGPLNHRRFNGLWHDFHLQVGFLADADRAVNLFGGQLNDLVASGN